jgi:hypothetical protein
MDRQYFIELGFKTPDGPEIFGRFFAGNNCKRAGAIFSRLQGNRDINDGNVIFLTFVETSNGLPVDLDMIGCTLDELGENCKIITIELFKIYSLLPDTLKHRR